MQHDITLKNDLEIQWENYMEKKGWYSKEYIIQKYGTKENYVISNMRFYTFAVVKKGEWYEVGTMGWFGCSSETIDEDKLWEEKYFETFIQPLANNVRLTIIDCHI